MTTFQHFNSTFLPTQHYCGLLGADNQTVYVETWGAHEADDQAFMWQYDHWQGIGHQPLLTQTAQSPEDHPLSYGIQRQHGMREFERVSDWVRPLTIADKMALIPRMGRPLAPMMLLGVAASTVWSVVSLPEAELVCRRVGIAVALPSVQVDDFGMTYDYEIVPLFVAHLYNGDEPLLEDCFAPLWGVALSRPMNALLAHHHLWIAESGTPEIAAQVHLWRKIE